MKNVAMARSSRNLIERLAGRGAMKDVAIAGSRIHESCRLCTMKNVAFLPSVPWETSPLAMRNVALVWSDRSVTMRNVALVRSKSAPCAPYEAQNGNYLALDHQTRVYHGKCRFEP